MAGARRSTVGQNNPPLGKIRIEIGDCTLGNLPREGASKNSELDAVDDLRLAMERQKQRAADTCGPNAKGARVRFVDVQLPKRAGIDVRSISVRHDRSRRGSAPQRQRAAWPDELSGGRSSRYAARGLLRAFGTLGARTPVCRDRSPPLRLRVPRAASAVETACAGLEPLPLPSVNHS